MYEYSHNELYHYGVKGMKWGHRNTYSNREITKEKNRFYDKTYKELYSKYEKTNRPVAADRAHAQAKKLNTKHLVDTYGKERMDKYYESERKKVIAAGGALVGSMAAMSVVALIGNNRR